MLDDASYVTIFGNKAWKISKEALVVKYNVKSKTLYTLHILGLKHNVTNVIEQPSVELWHKRLWHMSQKGMKFLSCLVTFLGFHFRTLNFVIIVFM